MLKIIARTATHKLKIKRSMARLFQSYIYTVLDNDEHEGYRHVNGKIFKAMNFRIVYHRDTFEINYTAYNPDNEVALAKDILKNGIKLGAVHFADTTVELINRNVTGDVVQCKGYVSAAIKDGNTDGKIYLEPSSAKFREIVVNNAIEKYEAITGTPYDGELGLKVLYQSPDKLVTFYDKQRIGVWFANYEITANKSMMDLLLTTGMGANTMKNLGFLEVEDG